MENIGDRVRRIRKQKGIERKALAQRTGMSYTGLSDLESGKARTTTKLHRLAEELGVDVRYLETGEGDQDSRIKPDETESQSAGFDPQILAATHRALRKLHEERGEIFSLEDDPEHFLQAYNLHLELDRKAPGADPVGIFKAAGLVIGKRGAVHGRSRTGKADVPDDGADAGKVAGKVQRKTR